MVEGAKWALTHTNADPKIIAEVWGVTEKECWEYFSDLQNALNEEERLYDPIAVQREARAFADSIPEGKNIRIECIKEKLIDSKIHPEKYDVPKLLKEVALLKDPTLRPTAETIARAKAYPIATLLNQTRKGNVSCPLHKDNKPSLQIKENNTFTCYSCGQYGDSIHLYRLMNNVDFFTAVKALQ